MNIGQQFVNPPVSDPNGVNETLSNGPINLSIVGTMATMTFTTVRPDVKQAFTGSVKDVSAIVVSRLTMPFENLVQLRDMLNQTIQNAAPLTPTFPGTPRKQ